MRWRIFQWGDILVVFEKFTHETSPDENDPLQNNPPYSNSKIKVQDCLRCTAKKISIVTTPFLSQYPQRSKSEGHCTCDCRKCGLEAKRGTWAGTTWVMLRTPLGLLLGKPAAACVVLSSSSSGRMNLYSLMPWSTKSLSYLK